MKDSPISRLIDKMALSVAGRTAQTAKKNKMLQGLFQ
jgi:hypothetical protein